MIIYALCGALGVIILGLFLAYRSGLHSGVSREKSRWLTAQGAANQNAMEALAEMNHEEELARTHARDALRDSIDVASASDELSNFTTRTDSAHTITSPAGVVRSKNSAL